MDKVYDIIVVGAGIGGSAIATTCARQGREVLLLERKLKEPDRIVGELLQPGGVAALAELGLASCLDDIDAIPVRGYHIYWKDEDMTFWYPPWAHDTAKEGNKEPYSAEPLPDDQQPRAQGRSFHHGRFVSKLRHAAQSEKRVTVVESNVAGLLHDEENGAVVGLKCLNGEKETHEARV